MTFLEKPRAPVQNQAIEKAWENYEKLGNSQEVLDAAETELYRHYDAWKRLLYVGISCSGTSRLPQHMRKAPWHRLITSTEVERWPTRELAHLAEKQAIWFERPYFNKRHSRFRHEWKRPEAHLHRALCGDKDCKRCSD